MGSFDGGESFWNIVRPKVCTIKTIKCERKQQITDCEDSPHDRKEVKLSVEKLMFERPLYQSYQAMLSRIFTALEIESVSTRAVALRALINLSAKDVSFMEKVCTWKNQL